MGEICPTMDLVMRISATEMDSKHHIQTPHENSSGIFEPRTSDRPAALLKRHCCPQCPNTYTKRYSLKNHLITHSPDNPHKCPTCNLSCSSANALKRHLETHIKREIRNRQTLPSHGQNQAEEKVDQTPKLSCTICWKEFELAKSLKDHMRRSHTHDGQKPFPCQMCTKAFVFPAELKYHVQIYHSVPVNCPSCGKYCRSELTLKEHLKRHTCQGAYKCTYCRMRFRIQLERKVHIKESHGKLIAALLVCSICGRKCASRNNLASHVRSHSGEKPFQCTTCYMQFGTKGGLRIHSRVHAENVIQSPTHTICGVPVHPMDVPRKESKGNESSSLGSDLYKRFQLTIPVPRMTLDDAGDGVWELSCEGNYWYLCCKCGRGHKSMSFIRKHGLQCEIVRPLNKPCNEGRIQDPLAIPTLKDANLKPAPPPVSGKYVCRFCGKSFNWRSSMRQHVATVHENNLKHACNTCGKRFFKPSKLRKHALTHAGMSILGLPLGDEDVTAQAPPRKTPPSSKPHVCSICGKSFRYLSFLKTHYQRSHDEKPFPISFPVPELTVEIGPRSLDQDLDPQNGNVVSAQGPSSGRVCRICSKSFSSPTNLRRHEISHLANRVQCSECPLEFRADRLAVHLDVWHRGIKFTSKYCDRLFRSISQKSRHEQIHRNKGICQPARVEASNSSDPIQHKQHSCKTCGMKFRLLGSLRLHGRVHLLVDRIKCPMCPRTYRWNSSLLFHMTRHHNGNGQHNLPFTGSQEMSPGDQLGKKGDIELADSSLSTDPAEFSLLKEEFQSVETILAHTNYPNVVADDIENTVKMEIEYI